MRHEIYVELEYRKIKCESIFPNDATMRGSELQNEKHNSSRYKETLLECYV